MINLKDLEKQLSPLYDTADYFGRTVIVPPFSLDGDGIKYYFYLIDDRVMRIETDEVFEAWFEQITYNEREKYWDYVKAINKRFGTEWDEENKTIFISFRRNELSIPKALTRLHQAVLLLSGLSFYTYS